jgi:hypothetical protein
VTVESAGGPKAAFGMGAHFLLRPIPDIEDVALPVVPVGYPGRIACKAGLAGIKHLHPFRALWAGMLDPDFRAAF